MAVPYDLWKDKCLDTKFPRLFSFARDKLQKVRVFKYGFRAFLAVSLKASSKGI
jgi:hypothetical protein